MPSTRRVAVLGGVRIPFCQNNTAYFDVGNQACPSRRGALVDEFGLQGRNWASWRWGGAQAFFGLESGRARRRCRPAVAADACITLQRAWAPPDTRSPIGNKIAWARLKSASVGLGHNFGRADRSQQEVAAAAARINRAPVSAHAWARR